MAVTQPKIDPKINVVTPQTNASFNVISPEQMAATQPSIAPPTNSAQAPNFNVGMAGQLPTTTPQAAQIAPPNQTPPQGAIDTNLFLQPGESSTQYTERVNKYQAGFAQTKDKPIPTEPGAAKAMVKQTLPNEQTPSIADTLTQTDPFFQGLQQTIQDYFNPVNQRVSLAEEYKNLLKDSGIQELDMELLNMRNIIEGSEDDIRTEITKSGGFATDSQVLALTNARNKQLIKNYNTLLETRNSKEQYLDKMMTFSAQDRADADRRFDQMMNIGFKMVEYRDKMQQNAVNSYNRIVDNIGYDGLYNQAVVTGDPQAISRIEKTLGIGQGGLVELAQFAAGQRARGVAKEELELERLQSGLETDELQRTAIVSSLETDKARRAEIYASIAEKKMKPIEEQKKIEQKVNNSVNKAGIVLKKINEAGELLTIGSTGFLGNIFKGIGGSTARQLQGKLDTIKANLSFDTLQAMREASPTGGALGSTSDNEINLLGSTVASLDIAQGKAALQSSLRDVETHYTNWLATVGYSVAPDGNIVQITE